MIRNNNIYRWIFILAVFPILLSACLQEEDYGECPNQSEKIQLTLSLPEQTRIATNTRALSNRVDYSIVNNLNLVLAKGENIAKVYYFDGSSITPDDGNVVMTRNTLPMKPEEGDDKRYITIIGEEGEFDGITEVYAVANYNKSVSVKNISELKALQQTQKDGKPSVDKDCMMLGSTTTLNNGSISLKRTLAMFSVKMNGSELKEGVRITPKSISLHNVPASCFIGNDNSIGKNSIVSVTTGESINVTEAEGWGALTKGNTLGGHEQEAGTIPFFMFENRQGKNENIKSINEQVTKHPADFTGNIKNPQELQSFLDNNKKYTYLLIEADYYYQDPTNPDKGVQGTIAYRFLLGNNEYNDFNIERNNYYQITLNLKGNGGASEDGKEDTNGNLLINNEDLSWRVDMKISDWGFVKDDFDFDCHATHGYLEVVGDGWTISGGNQSGNSFIKFYSEDKKMWVEPTEYGACGKNGKIEYYVQTWSLYAAGFNGKEDMSRSITLTISKAGATQTVTIKQWTPIFIKDNIYVERFEENETELSWGYMGNEMGGSVNVNYISRSFSFGTDTKFNGMQNTWYMYNKIKDESPAQVYCYRKGGDDLSEHGTPASNSDTYCLPDAETMKTIMEYKYKGSNPFQPIRTDKDYWTGSADSNNKKATYYCSMNPNTGEVVLQTTSQRNEKKRVRAIYRVNPY